MLRYFIAGNFWFAFALILVLAKGYARHSPDYYTVLGFGWIAPTAFWSVVLAAMVAASVYAIAWRRTISPQQTA
jgi:hypothetical protein